ncbi:hypothetical protein K491DRAFT_689299 [Lophiostoma macrostomum CBS 122681]|uniref:F-box domain-containing protein n=1 Tax=Lophiostoma macrostomum CBS 122681 TaxID=1314788 RepID=A0A6A6TKG7_9PLEO|nr:hypothetical protein K491DRAFT_689299 [Lophiostoma macrostomum CBS 122681]
MSVLLPLARVCRRFNDIAAELIYGGFSGRSLRKTEEFGQTIFANPKLANHVKHLHMGSFTGPCSTDTLTMMERGLRISPAYLHGGSNQSIGIGRITTYIACRCPHILSMELAGDIDSMLFVALNAAADHTLSAMHCLSQLRTLIIAPPKDQRCGTTHLSAIMKLPSLRKFVLRAGRSRGKAVGVGDLSEESMKTISRCSDQTSSIQELILDGRCLEDRDKADICILQAIRSCRTLTHFTYQMDFSVDLSSTSRKRTALLNALGLHQRTLQLIEIEDCSMSVRMPADGSQALRGLEEFNQLTTLALSSSTIFGASSLGLQVGDILPPRLQCLQLQYDDPTDPSGDNNFLKILRACIMNLSSLKEVHVSCRLAPFVNSGRLPLHFRHLERAFIAEGVVFTYSIEYIQGCLMCTERVAKNLQTLVASGPDGREIARHCYGLSLCGISCYDAHVSILDTEQLYLSSWDGVKGLIDMH